MRYIKPACLVHVQHACVCWPLRRPHVHSNAAPMDLSSSPRSRLLVFLVSLFALIYNLSDHLPKYHAVETPRAPVDAQKIQAKCLAIKSAPGPSPLFLKREVSDRFEVGTNSTLISNATILMGKGNETHTLHGDLYLDKGIVKAIGSLSHLNRANVLNLSTINANGAWVTPGLGISFSFVDSTTFPEHLSVDLHTHLGLMSAPFMAGEFRGKYYCLRYQIMCRRVRCQFDQGTNSSSPPKYRRAEHPRRWVSTRNCWRRHFRSSIIRERQ